MAIDILGCMDAEVFHVSWDDGLPTYTCPLLDEGGDREFLVLDVRLASPMAPVRLELEEIGLISEERLFMYWGSP